ncbi:hypothetical protein EVAR_59421_1 [Eumeta japonica]|uniref:Uncharacterized protein n=1 Tax=Eumeta variegata TaxID=151549 RepID=A0A4C1Z3I7_EUMVA|nr:hypothetical protein EVAR_59421_1 [Eumeta japonica]
MGPGPGLTKRKACHRDAARGAPLAASASRPIKLGRGVCACDQIDVYGIAVSIFRTRLSIRTEGARAAQNLGEMLLQSLDSIMDACTGGARKKVPLSSHSDGKRALHLQCHNGTPTKKKRPSA